MERPGIMLYFEMLEPIRVLSDEQKGQLLVAMLEYGQYGVVPEFEGLLAVAWAFLRPKLDRDGQEYRMAVLRRRYAVWCRERKKRGDPEVDFEGYLTGIGIGDDQCYPTTTVTPTPTTSTTATAAAAATGMPGGEIRAVGGELGRQVVFLTDAQMADLLDKMDLETFDHYVDKLANFIIRNGARVRNHYETILRWHREDGQI